MMITQTLKTSLLMKQEEILILRENDKNNQIKFLFNDLTGITSAEFRLIKPDDTFVIVTGEINADDNSITFDVYEQMCAVPGNARFNIRLIGDNMNVYTYVSRCIIDINLDLDNAIESTAEVNGYTFPDDFALKSEIPDTDDFATKNYVDIAIETAIESIPTYTPPDYSASPHKTGQKWINGKDIWEVTLTLETGISVTPSGSTLPSAVMESLNIDNILMSRGYRQRSDIGAGICDITTDIWLDSSNNWRIYSFTSWDNIKTFTIQYTKEGE